MNANISVLWDSEPAPHANQLWLRLPMTRGASLAGNNVSYSVKARYRIVHHDAELKTAHHDAVTHTETYCTGCGVIW